MLALVGLVDTAWQLADSAKDYYGGQMISTI